MSHEPKPQQGLPVDNAWVGDHLTSDVLTARFRSGALLSPILSGQMHDSQAAIPLAITFSPGLWPKLYDLMDAAYGRLGTVIRQHPFTQPRLPWCD